jgi:hypothetical protein
MSAIASSSDGNDPHTRYQRYFDSLPFDPSDPLPTMALYWDDSTPMDPETKAALLYGLQSWSRQYFLPIIRPFMRTLICIIKVLKTFFPSAFKSSGLLHYLIYLGLRFFASREANLLIMRHFHIGSEVLQFILDNSGLRDQVPMQPLLPRQIADVKNHLFLQHDINLYNFIIRLNQSLRKEGRSLQPVDHIDFSAITDGPFDIGDLPNRWHNFMDVETAIEAYTPIFQFFLSDNDFWRASNSLQLDETIGIYVSTLLGDNSRLWRINNRHPLVPLSTLRAGFRLLLHGYSSESLHYMLRLLKRRQAASMHAKPIQPPA